jgi:hypothetical protein
MRDPEDTKYVWDEKNLNIIKESLCSNSYTEEVLKLLIDACIEYEIIDVKATEGSAIKTINEFEFSIGEDHFVLNLLYYHNGKITFSGFVSYSNDDFFTSLGIQDFITRMKDSLEKNNFLS